MYYIRYGENNQQKRKRGKIDESLARFFDSTYAILRGKERFNRLAINSSYDMYFNIDVIYNIFFIWVYLGMYIGTYVICTVCSD